MLIFSEEFQEIRSFRSILAFKGFFLINLSVFFTECGSVVANKFAQFRKNKV